MIHSRKRIQAIIFDLDDTLIDWSDQNGNYVEFMRPHLDNIYDYLQERDHHLPTCSVFYDSYIEVLIKEWQAAKKTWSGVNFAAALEKFLNSLDLDCQQIDFDEVLRVFDMQPIPGVTLFQDTLTVLETLQRKDYKIGLITNSMMPMWMRDVELKAYGILDFFDVRLTSGDVGYMKPHPEIFQRALQILDVQPQRSLFVGDRPANDIAGANAAGLISVLMSPPHLERELNDIQPDHIINELSQLIPILDKLELNDIEIED